MGKKNWGRWPALLVKNSGLHERKSASLVRDVVTSSPMRAHTDADKKNRISRACTHEYRSRVETFFQLLVSGCACTLLRKVGEHGTLVFTTRFPRHHQETSVHL